MRKVLGILFSVFLLVPGIKISLDRHFCCGELADVKVSITGKMATCGMENEENPYHGMPFISGRCCEDQLTILNLDYSYFPETTFYKNLKITRDIPAGVFICLITDGNALIGPHSKVLPPGNSLPHGPEQAEICLFLI